ncbi:hypothetical protein FPQ18DRAFT_310136 [Pyronema domesticum]|nr:hypothetical protein FPQ18DRAFT_310136 [Pyronema domesticum]
MPSWNGIRSGHRRIPNQQASTTVAKKSFRFRTLLEEDINSTEYLLTYFKRTFKHHKKTIAYSEQLIDELSACEREFRQVDVNWVQHLENVCELFETTDQKDAQEQEYNWSWIKHVIAKALAIDGRISCPLDKDCMMNKTYALNKSRQELNQRITDPGLHMIPDLLKPRLQSLANWLTSDDSMQHHYSKMERLVSPYTSKLRGEWLAEHPHAYKTGEWLFRHPKYKQWETSRMPGLWIQGSPGCGKSVLA